MAKITLDTSDVEKAQRELDALDAAARRADDRLDALRRSSETASARLDRVGGAAVKFRGALSALSPEAASVAGTVDDAADAVEGLSRVFGLSAAAMGPVAVAVAGLAAAYAYLSAEEREAEEATRRAAEAASAYQAAAVPLSETLDDIATRVRVANGELTAGEAAAQRQQAQLQERAGAMRQLIAAEVAHAEAAYRASGMNRELYLAWDAARQRLAAFDERVSQAADNLELLAEKDEIERAAKDASTRSTRAAEDALRSLNAAMDAENGAATANARAYAGALEALNAYTERTGSSALERAAAENRATQAAIEAQRARALAAASTTSAVEEAERAARDARLTQERLYAEQVDEINRGIAEKLDQQRDERLRKDEEAARARAAAEQAAFGSVGDALGALSALSTDANGEATAASKRWAIAQVEISAAAAMIRAWAELGPIGAILGTAAIGLQSAAAIRQIEQAHQGMERQAHQGMAPDELRILRSEIGGVLNSQAVRANPGLATALNRGATIGGPTYVDLRVGPATQREVVASQLRGDTDLTRRMKSTSKARAGYSGTGSRA